MPFTATRTLLGVFCHNLENTAPLTPIQLHVRKGLRYIQSNAAVFNVCVSQGTPFFEEFFAILNEGKTTHDACFALFECLVIFFREKRLRMGDSQSAHVENEILNFFEKSGEWNKNIDMLVCHWYWKELPRRIARSLRRQYRKHWDKATFHLQAAL